MILKLSTALFFRFTISLIILLLFSTASYASPSTKPSIEILEKKIQQLESQHKEMELRQTELYTNFVQGNSKINTFLDRKVSIGGFFETSLVNLSGPDMESQVSASSQIFGLNFAVELNPQFHFVGQLLTAITYPLTNPHNNPNVTPNKRQYAGVTLATIVAQSYLEYAPSSAFRIQSGIGYVPFGNAYQQRDFFLFQRRGGPQMTNTTNATTVGMAFPLWMGVHILGTFQKEEHRWGYDFYSFSPALKPKTLGGGTRFWYSPNDGFTAGISGQTAQNLNDTYYVYGADLNFKKDLWGLTVEYARNVSSAPDGTPESYYMEPSYLLPNQDWRIYLVADYISYPNLKTSAALVEDGYQKWLFGGGINWMPLPVAKFRLGLLSHDYIGDSATINGQQRDYFNVDLSCSVAF